MPQASSLAAELKSELAADARLIEGDNGVFDVVVDGKPVYSKHETGRFPDPGEVVKAIRS